MAHDHPQRDARIDPKPMDRWRTAREGEIVVIGAILTRSKSGKIAPFVVFDGSGMRYAVMPYAWRNLIKGAEHIYSPEKFLLDNGVEVPPYPGLP